MLWFENDLDAEQVPVEFPDTIAALLQLPERLVLVFSVYVLNDQTLGTSAVLGGLITKDSRS